LWHLSSPEADQRETNPRVIRGHAASSLRVATAWFGFAIASAKRREEPVADVADIENDHRRRMAGATMDLFEADHSLLRRPVERQVDMRGEFQIG
jgi:hypothetical protein